jgi:methylmalonyl-CoA mutase cobalamin-binding subunit
MTTAQLAATRLNLNQAWCEALFASGLQPSDAPTADMVAEAIDYTVQAVGISGCVGQMAQEFGDHPDAAAERMRWARQLAAWAAVRPNGHHAYQAAGAER